MRHSPFIVVIVPNASALFARDIPLNRYGFAVVNSPELHQKLAEKDSNLVIVDLKTGRMPEMPAGF